MKPLEGKRSSSVAGTGGAVLLNADLLGSEFSGPVGICVDLGGVLYVSDVGNNRVRRVDRALGTVSNQGAEISSLRFLEVGADSTLYVGGWCRIYTIAPEGGISAFAGTGVNSLRGWSPNVGVGLAHDGTSYAASSHGKIFRIDPAGKAEHFAGDRNSFDDGPRLDARFSSPGDLAVDRLGNVYVSDIRYVRKISPGGRVSTPAGALEGPGFLDGPTDPARAKGK